jgi:hypothetical protein
MLFPTAQPGDTVRSKATGQAYVITGHYGDRLTAVRTVDITNEDEWTWLGNPTRPSAAAQRRWLPPGERRIP